MKNKYKNSNAPPRARGTPAMPVISTWKKSVITCSAESNGFLSVSRRIGMTARGGDSPGAVPACSADRVSKPRLGVVVSKPRQKKCEAEFEPPWYARGIPMAKLRDGPELKIRGKPEEVGRWKTEVGRRKTEDGRRKTEVGRRKTEDGRRKTEVGRRKTEVGRRKTEDACLPVGREVEVQKARGRPPMGKCVDAGKHELISRQGTGRDLPQWEADLSAEMEMKYLTLSSLKTLTGWKKRTCQRSQNLTTSTGMGTVTEMKSLTLSSLKTLTGWKKRTCQRAQALTTSKRIDKKKQM